MAIVKKDYKFFQKYNYIDKMSIFKQLILIVIVKIYSNSQLKRQKTEQTKK